MVPQASDAADVGVEVAVLDVDRGACCDGFTLLCANSRARSERPSSKAGQDCLVGLVVSEDYAEHTWWSRKGGTTGGLVRRQEVPETCRPEATLSGRRARGIEVDATSAWEGRRCFRWSPGELAAAPTPPRCPPWSPPKSPPVQARASRSTVGSDERGASSVPARARIARRPRPERHYGTPQPRAGRMRPQGKRGGPLPSGELVAESRRPGGWSQVDRREVRELPGFLALRERSRSCSHIGRGSAGDAPAVWACQEG